MIREVVINAPFVVHKYFTRDVRKARHQRYKNCASP